MSQDTFVVAQELKFHFGIEVLLAHQELSYGFACIPSPVETGRQHTPSVGKVLKYLHVCPRLSADAKMGKSAARGVDWLVHWKGAHGNFPVCVRAFVHMHA
jgi:hypothetical protein